MKLSVVVNTQSGSMRDRDPDAFERQLRQALDGSDLEPISVHRTDRPIDEMLDAAADERSDTILIVGGDGSVAAAAAIAWRTGKRLAVLPGGTMNLCARTLGMPLDLERGLVALRDARLAPMDIATANGTPFLHQYSVGLHADAIRLRQRARTASARGEGHRALPISGSRWSKILSTVRAFLAVIADPPSVEVRLSTDGGEPRSTRYSALSIANNPFGEGHLPYADEPDSGHLGLYASQPLRAWDAATLMRDIVLGVYHSNEHVSVGTAQRVDLEFPHSRRRSRRRTMALLDGELIALAESVAIEKHAGAIDVLRPAAEGMP